MDFGGLSLVALGHFAPPKGFWRGISAHKFNSHTKKALSKPENPVLVLIKHPIHIAVYSGLIGLNRPHPPRDICHSAYFN
jgi:hypothetical protein